MLSSLQIFFVKAWSISRQLIESLSIWDLDDHLIVVSLLLDLSLDALFIGAWSSLKPLPSMWLTHTLHICGISCLHESLSQLGPTRQTSHRTWGFLRHWDHKQIRHQCLQTSHFFFSTNDCLSCWNQLTEESKTRYVYSRHLSAFPKQSLSSNAHDIWRIQNWTEKTHRPIDNTAVLSCATVPSFPLTLWYFWFRPQSFVNSMFFQD